MISHHHTSARGSISLARLLAPPAPMLIAVLLGCSAASSATKADSSAASTTTASAAVIPGVEVLLSDSIHLVRGKRVGLITNHSGRDRAGTSTIDLLHKAPGVKLTALFGPEHGLRGVAKAGEQVASTVDSATGVPIYSLYGQTQVPNAQMLENVDVLVYDIQDVGARVYTYEWTMALSAEAAKKPFIVLDRFAATSSRAGCSTRSTAPSWGSTR
jgi:uncharacterized protein YbbC (DUF1343 family)